MSAPAGTRPDRFGELRRAIQEHDAAVAQFHGHKAWHDHDDRTVRAERRLDDAEEKVVRAARAAVSIASVTALAPVTDAIRLVRLKLHADDPEAATRLIDELAAKLGLS